MGELPDNKTIIKRMVIVLGILAVILLFFLLKSGFDKKREEEIWSTINNAIIDTENKAEESNQEDAAEDGENIELVDKFEFNYDDENGIVVGINRDILTGEISVSAYCHYLQKNIDLVQRDFISIFAAPFAAGIDVTAYVDGEEETYIFLMNDRKILMNTIPLEEVEEIPEEYLELSKEMLDGITDFYVKNGITEKSYNTLVYEDEKVKIFFTRIDDKGVNFSVDNLTDSSVTIQARSIAINGISTNSIIMSDDVAPMSTGKATARCDDFVNVDKIEKISGELRIISDNWDSYSATFSEIEVE